NFKPKQSYKPKTNDARQLQHVSGRVWIAEDDHEFVRLEAEVIDPIKIGAGLLAKLQKGSMMNAELRKINDEIWLPAKFELLLNWPLLLVKGLNMRIVVEFSDHQKIQRRYDFGFSGAQMKKIVAVVGLLLIFGVFGGHRPLQSARGVVYAQRQASQNLVITNARIIDGN